MFEFVCGVFIIVFFALFIEAFVFLLITIKESLYDIREERRNRNGSN